MYEEKSPWPSCPSKKLKFIIHLRRTPKKLLIHQLKVLEYAAIRRKPAEQAVLLEKPQELALTRFARGLVQAALADFCQTRKVGHYSPPHKCGETHRKFEHIVARSMESGIFRLFPSLCQADHLFLSPKCKFTLILIIFQYLKPLFFSGSMRFYPRFFPFHLWSKSFLAQPCG